MSSKTTSLARSFLFIVLGSLLWGQFLGGQSAGVATAQEAQESHAASRPLEFELDNGMRFLLVARKGAPITAAVWVVRTGSSSDPVGATGTAHLLEHLFFRGSETIGTRKPTAMAEERRLMKREEQLYRRRAAPADSGIGGPKKESNEEFERQAAELAKKLRQIEVKGDFARLYTEHDAVGINALTRKDLTTFWVSFPPTKLELWFWLESDRLRDAVLRGFYQELPVVEQERRQRIDAVPGGLELERFNEAFWLGHPYAWPAIGRAQDLYRLHRGPTEEFIKKTYTADRLTAVLVGDLDEAKVRSWAELYFADLPGKNGKNGKADKTAAPLEGRPPLWAKPEPLALTLECECQSRVELRFHTVPFAHPDAIALDLLADVLAGRSGRLHRELTLGSDAISSAVSTHTPLALAGSFSIEVAAQEGIAPAVVESQTLGLLARLLADGVTQDEVERARNQRVTEAARQVKAPLSLALRLGVYDALGDWRRVYELPERLLAVDAVQLTEVARRYLDPKKASVLRLERSER